MKNPMAPVPQKYWPPVPPKYWPRILGGVGEGVGTCKKYSELGLSGKISHIYGPDMSKSAKDGAPDVTKVELQGKPTGILSDRFFSSPTGGPTVGPWAALGFVAYFSYRSTCMDWHASALTCRHLQVLCPASTYRDRAGTFGPGPNFWAQAQIP